MPRPQCPPIAADVIVEIGDQIVLIERKNFPFGWAIPGGFVDFGETVEETAMREASEEISLEVKLRGLLGIYSRPERDPRGQTVTAVYIGRAIGTPRGADDAKQARLFSLDNLPSTLAFDHTDVLADYKRFLKTGEFPAPWHRPSS
jgi:8-oxo-dGTP diphosphatase